MSERVPDDAFEVLVRAEGTWREAMRPQNTAETRLAIEARRARASEVALRADLAKAKERLAAAENLRCIGPGHPDGPTCLEDGASREELCSSCACHDAEAQLAKAKERIAELEAEMFTMKPDLGFDEDQK